MKKLNVRLLFIAVVLTAFTFNGCKSKSKDNSGTTTASDTAVTTTTTAPVIAGNDELQKGVTDATKDYPSVKADVVDSVINVSGEITRTDWQRLVQTLNSLHPKRINSNTLTIK